MDETVKIQQFACPYCEKTYRRKKSFRSHQKEVHKIDANRGNRRILCPQCKVTVLSIEKLREHIKEIHDVAIELEELQFASYEEFQVWKGEMEKTTKCKYIRKQAPAVISKSHKCIYFQCHRSGIYRSLSSGKRNMKRNGSIKMNSHCPSTVNVSVYKKGVIVKFWKTHFGHKNDDMGPKLLTQDEKFEIAKSVSKGIPYERLLDEIKDSASSQDYFHVQQLQKKANHNINNAYNSSGFCTGMSDAESVDHWARSFCDFEVSPILCYKNEPSDNGDFFLVIMTEFQKSILLDSDKQVLCVDSLFRKEGGRFYLTILFTMDKNEPFPAAFCISNKVDKDVICMFFQSVKDSTGTLECTFFMSDCDYFFYKSWKEVMNDNSRWLWSMCYVDSRFRIQLRVFGDNVTKKVNAYRTMRMLLECHDETVFQCMLDNFIENLENDPDSKNLSSTVKHHYAPNAEKWAYCYRKEIDLGTNVYFEIMHRIFRYCCQKGRKERLDKFIFVIMKLVRDKMFHFLTNMKNEEIQLTIETLNAHHYMGLEILPEQITALSEKSWIVHANSEGEKCFVMLESPTCPDHCNLKCSECDICVHMFVCCCNRNLVAGNLCQHIHAVAWHLLMPRFTPPSTPTPFNEVTEKCDISSEFSEVLKKTRELYKQMQVNKCNLKTIAVEKLMKRLDECIEICTGKFSQEKLPPIEAPVKMGSQVPTSIAFEVPTTVSQVLATTTEAPAAASKSSPTVLQVPVTIQAQAATLQAQAAAIQAQAATIQAQATTTQASATTTQAPATTSSQVPVTSSQVPVTSSQVPVTSQAPAPASSQVPATASSQASVTATSQATATLQVPATTSPATAALKFLATTASQLAAPIAKPGTLVLMNRVQPNSVNNQPIALSNSKAVNPNSAPQGKKAYVLLIPSTAISNPIPNS